MLDHSKNLPSPHSPEELEKLISLVRSISDFPQMSEEEQEFLVDSLMDYECYAQVIKILEWRSSEPGRSSDGALSDFCKLMMVHYEGLESFEKFCDVAERCVKTLKLPFATIRLHIADEILGPDNFEEQAKLYQSLAGSLPDISQRVLLLSRLALIVEKKLFRESEAEPIYRSIIRLDPLNIKALRYYRLWYGQGGDWEQAAKQLQSLIKAYRNPHEKHRAAHELAQIYLYNLNQPNLAKKTLETHCRDSRLDTRQTLVEALERLGDYEELIDCLDGLCERAGDRSERAAILQKKGLVCLKSGQYEKAKQSLHQSLSEDSHNLLTHEALITSLINLDQSEELERAIQSMAQASQSPTSRQKLTNLASVVATSRAAGLTS